MARLIISIDGVHAALNQPMQQPTLKQHYTENNKDILGSVQKYFGGRGLGNWKIVVKLFWPPLRKPQNFLTPKQVEKLFEPPCIARCIA